MRLLGGDHFGRDRRLAAELRNLARRANIFAMYASTQDAGFPDADEIWYFQRPRRKTFPLLQRTTPWTVLGVLYLLQQRTDNSTPRRGCLIVLSGL